MKVLSVATCLCLQLNLFTSFKCLANPGRRQLTKEITFVVRLAEKLETTKRFRGKILPKIKRILEFIHSYCYFLIYYFGVC